MSYGWLTESSLLPKKAVKIGGVSDSSLYTLSSQIFSLQQEQQQKPLEFLSGLKSQRVVCPPGSQEREGECVERAARQAETEASEHSKLRGPEGGLESEGGQEVGRARRRRRGSHDSGSEEESGCVRGNAYPGSVRRWGRPSKKPLHWQARLMEAKNPRVEERAAADAQFVAAHAKTLEASRRKLEEKAKLYDDVISGRKDASEAPACARQLIDFEDKLCRAPPISLRTGSDSHSEPLSSEPQESLLFGAASARFTYEGEERRMSGEEGEAVSYERQSATTGEKTSWHAGWRDGVPDEPMETSGHSGDEQQSWRQRGRDLAGRAEEDRRTTEGQNQFLCALSKETERRRDEVEETKKQRLSLLRTRLLILREAAAAAAAAADNEAATNALMKAAKAEATLNRERMVDAGFDLASLS
ncbi:hypothetical protein TGRH88_021540 [Toxoplasma gondii]|uniref:Uncharacterized protein n=2 Tax=Toxoplasma gondii TaxID=5811 RepID=A0A0F7UNR7_TOXGV|nr:hypothetical protein TGRH88_021540 [Toxoplasma gondii]CEL71765.1 TPA: hypothetical protein BN1205_038930 [Toxoplasma gondii VEG]